jgi:hypothetical protein
MSVNRCAASVIAVQMYAGLTDALRTIYFSHRAVMRPRHPAALMRCRNFEDAEESAQQGLRA